ncbi:MAG: hypothetical protein ABIH26_13055 [Candidatus Eisenbacteria bacterium]
MVAYAARETRPSDPACRLGIAGAMMIGMMSGTSFPRRLSLLGVGVVFLVGYASIRGTPWLWGVHHLAFFPPALRFLVIAAALAACAPPVARAIAARAAPFGTTRAGTAGRLGPVLLLGTAAVAFWKFRVAAHLLGDGRILPNAVADGRWWTGPEGLSTTIHAIVFRVVRPLGAADATSTYAGLSMAAGLVYVGLALLYARRASRSHGERVLALLVLLTLGVMQAFFGYVEAYALSFPAALAYLIAGHDAVVRKRSVGPAVALFAFLVLLHVTYAAWAVSLGVVLYTAHRRRHGRRAAILVAAGTTTVIAGLLTGGVLGSISALSKGEIETRAISGVLPLCPGGNINRDLFPYALFSWTHALNLINQGLLVFPGVLVLLLALAPRRARGKAPRSEAAGTGGDRFSVFLASAGLAQAAGFFFLRPQYGAFGDWDLLSLPALPIALLTVRLAAARWRTGLAPIAVVVTAMQLLVLLPRIALNADADRCQERYLRLLRTYPGSWDVVSLRIAYRLHLVQHFRSRGDAARALEMRVEGLRASRWNPRLFHDDLLECVAETEALGGGGRSGPALPVLARIDPARDEGPRG